MSKSVRLHPKKSSKALPVPTGTINGRSQHSNASSRQPSPEPEAHQGYSSRKNETVIVNPKSRYCTSDVVKFSTKYGLINCVKILVMACLGAGMFTTPNSVFISVRNEGGTLLVWFFSGVIALMGSLSYAEMGATFLVSGGDYAYLDDSFGPFFGFLYQWGSNLVVVPCTNAILGWVIAQNLMAPFLPLQGLGIGEVIWQDVVTAFVAVGVIMVVSYLVSVNPKLSEDVRTFLFWTMVCILGSVILCGFIYLCRDGSFKHTKFSLNRNDNDNPFSKPKSKLGLASEVLGAMYHVAFSFGGFNMLNFVGEEIRSASKTLPLAIFISMPAILVTYLLIVFVHFVVLDQQLVHDSSVSIVTVLIQQSILPGWIFAIAQMIIPTLIAGIIVGTLLFRIVTFSRLVLVGCRMGHLPKVLGLISVVSNAPVVAVTFMAILTAFYVALIAATDLETFIHFATSLQLMFVALCAYALFYVRIKRPEIQRPFKLPLIVPIMFALIVTCLLLTPLVTLVLDLIYSFSDTHGRGAKYVGLLGGPLFLMVTGVPVYTVLLGDKKKRMKLLKILHDKLFLLAQKVFVAMPEGENFTKKKA